MTNPLLEIQNYGQSIWYDYIRRGLIISGELKRMIDEDGLRGVTSNPSIFEKAIAGSTDYNNTLKALEKQKDMEVKALYESLANNDIQDAADVMSPVYEMTKKRDGYVSLEVSPYLANDTRGTLDEARRLWKVVGRDNVMIKVPGTQAGIPAIKQLISEGINVNVTLLFSQETYEHVAEAYISGLEAFVAGGGDPSGVASVASFFVSRIDTAIDNLANARLKTAKNPSEQAILKSITGKVAIANAKLTYQRYKDICLSERWQSLAAKGAQTQRLLWASTSTKNPNYRDVLYVEELIGRDTVNTVPSATFDAFRQHGQPRASLEEHLEEAHDTMDVLGKVGISMREVTDKLLDDGVRLFSDAFDKLLSAIEKKREALLGNKLNRHSYKLPDKLDAAVKASLEDWRVNGKVRRLWSRDKTLWTNDDENRWLGWLGITEDQLAHIEHLKDIAEEVKKEGFSDALLLGMGGSSLCPEVMRMTFGRIGVFPELHVLDSTDPSQIRTFENKVDLARTLFIVSSKSGGTLEPNIFKQYFFKRVEKTIGAKKAGSRFIAITDPGSKMQQIAQAEGFRHIFFGVPSIGGRYSALSNFGMVPSAIMGVDVERFLDRAEEMVHSCSSCVPPEDNPGVVLGTIMGVLANNGRDKVTIVTSPGIWDLGAWLEQLLAESTGKLGKGLIPVDQERLGPPEVYGSDRLFAYLRLETAPDSPQDAAVAALEKAGHPVVRISLYDIYDLGQEMFRWEIGTAVAGSIIGINAFNQPDVEASKVATRNLTSEYEKTGSLPQEKPILEDKFIKLFTDDKNAGVLTKSVGNDKTIRSYIKAHLNRIKAGDYFCISAYIEMNDIHQEQLQAMRHAVRDAKKVATCLGYGPRFLHSTGQAYKGGPNTGVFLQITCDDASDLSVPGQKYTFGVVKAAQARGDFQVLAERNRRVLRVHLRKDVEAGLSALRETIEQALKQ
ncbi:MAG: bifunctional transaldolase/phosoglucose isomerase [Candidatus Dadabacteria bacterium]|nr:bifunctional transaldolase/phosoglucose isomerase [Candidatus Dadabacteria bacterium]